MSLLLAPLAYGPFQMRVGSLIKPAVLLNRWAAWGFMVGVAVVNLGSPFGPWDWFVMPVVSLWAGEIAWRLRRVPLVANLVHAAIIATGVTLLPLHLGGGIPILPTLVYVFVSEAVLYQVGWSVIWSRLSSTPRQTASSI